MKWIGNFAMDLIFQIVYGILSLASRLTGLTYNEVNIIAYYILLPFVYVFLADKILKRHFFKIGYILTIIVVLLYIPDFTEFSDWLFDASVDYLMSFELFGWNYIVASVLICVIFPGIVFLGMLHFAYPPLVHRIADCFKDPVREWPVDSEGS